MCLCHATMTQDRFNPENYKKEATHFKKRVIDYNNENSHGERTLEISTNFLKNIRALESYYLKDGFKVAWNDTAQLWVHVPNIAINEQMIVEVKLTHDNKKQDFNVSMSTAKLKENKEVIAMLKVHGLPVNMKLMDLKEGANNLIRLAEHYEISGWEAASWV